jgi:SAM-dependent methyltransferase
MSGTGFHDHFSGHSAEYSRYRPTYPREMFSFLAGLCSRRHTAWDAGTGSGQAAVMLADYFDRVIGTDPSAEQISQATAHPRVSYAVAKAEACGLPDSSVDLIAVAQALHWFDFQRFFAECDRVGRPGCVLAAWCYELLNISPEIDRIVTRYYSQVVGPYWPAERAHIEAKYTSIPIPYPRLPTPDFYMACTWSLPGLLGYLGTWSATKRCQAAVGVNPLVELEPELVAAWGDPGTPRRVVFPLTLVVCRVGAAERAGAQTVHRDA